MVLSTLYSSDDSLERTRATREMSLRSFFPAAARALGLSRVGNDAHEKGKRLLTVRHRYS